MKWHGVGIVRAAVILSAILIALLGAPPASGASIACTGAIESDNFFDLHTISGNLVVPADATCVLSGVEVNGNVTVEAGASLAVATVCHPEAPTLCSGAIVRGNLQAIRASSVVLTYTWIDGNIAVWDSGTVQLFRSSVGKNASFNGNEWLSLFDSGSGKNLSCADNVSVELFWVGATGHVSGQCIWVEP